MKTLILSLAVVLLAAVARAEAPAAPDLAGARAIIKKQMDLINAGDVAGLKAGFTARLQDRIDEKSVAKAKETIGKITIEEAVISATKGEDGKSVKLKMANGRSLTTLVLENEKWLTDTIWFK
jgi:hypothetical protein